MRPFRRLLAVLGIVAALLLSGANPAAAHTATTWQLADGCLLSLHDNAIGSLTANSGTCDGQDNYWAGRVRDDHATSDGFCVRAVLQGILMATSCNSTGTSFTFLDPNSNSNATTCIEESSGQFNCASNTGF